MSNDSSHINLYYEFGGCEVDFLQVQRKKKKKIGKIGHNALSAATK